jgi:CheY-like chemotaxis protein
VARIRETARLVGASVVFARTSDELERECADAPDLVLIDLTAAGSDYGALFGALEARAPSVPVLGFTTHVLARQTQPLHSRCDRVVTRETLTQELGRILADGIAKAERAAAADPAPSARGEGQG